MISNKVFVVHVHVLGLAPFNVSYQAARACLLALLHFDKVPRKMASRVCGLRIPVVIVAPHIILSAGKGIWSQDQWTPLTTSCSFQCHRLMELQELAPTAAHVDRITDRSRAG